MTEIERPLNPDKPASSQASAETSTPANTEASTEANIEASAFATPAASSDTWRRVSPKYAWADFATNLLFTLVVAAVYAFVALVVNSELPLITHLIFAAVIIAMLVYAIFAFRRVRAIGYVLREDDLIFRRGILFERVIAVPYGRLQLVDVTRGPLLRALGLSTLKFVTASAATGVHLPGLLEAEAEALRDRLVELAETRRSGL